MFDPIKNFFTPMVWEKENNPTKLEKVMETVDDYFYFGFSKDNTMRKARVVKTGSNGDYTVQLKQPYFWEIKPEREYGKLAAKILSLAIIVKKVPVIPVLAILSKALFRATHPIASVQMADEKMGGCNSRILDIQNSFINEKREITNGYGEFVVYKLRDNGKKELNKEEYAKIYQVLNQNRLWNSTRELRPRDQELTELLKSIDPSYEAAFVPRTLYDMMVVRKALEEDLEHGELCPKTCIKAEPSSRGPCWHDGSFAQIGNNNSPAIQRLALETNNIFIRKLPTTTLRFSTSDIQQMTEEQLTFFYEFHVNSHSETSKKAASMSDTIKQGLVIQFAQDIECCPIRSGMREDGTRVEVLVSPMGISSQNIANIYRNSIALECSPQAIHNAILYRGGNLQADYPIEASTLSTLHSRSLSYSSSLLAGAFFSENGGESVAYYGTLAIRKRENGDEEYERWKCKDGNKIFHYKNDNTFAYLVPYNELNKGTLFSSPYDEH
ncbi:MAG: hypothetical protein JSR46_12225, partial [Verrucomicrobia bacterium]|nr:hypothetical protein [Verrucomicrobiota bacterium]